ncbi:related to Protein C20orf43 [Sporisorium scitamineum]|nr:related to Protein C20orf43 [Sporisorium scitamineum]
MGNDGGSIAKRDELVRTKASFEKVDPELLRQSLWTVCALSRRPLEAPIVSDPLGRLYNKDSTVQHLLQRSQNDSSSSKTADPIPHIRGLRDITELNLTPNTLYRPPSPTTSSNQHSVYPFMCPLSSKQMDGKQRFVYIASCGCAMSATGLRTTVAASEASKDRPDDKPCPVCGKPFNAAGLAKGKQPEVGGSVVTINPSEAEEAEMREAMEKARAEQAARKKAKARTADQALEKGKAQEGDASEDKAQRKRRKAERKAEKSARIAALTAELAAEQS